MTAIAAQMWVLLLIAFAIGLVTGYWLRPPRRPAPPPAEHERPVIAAADAAKRAPPSPLAPALGPPDDLTAIRGIGPHYERVLKEAGLSTYRQIADLTAAQIAWLDERLGAGDRIAREDWPGQAQALLRRR